MRKSCSHDWKCTLHLWADSMGRRNRVKSAADHKIFVAESRHHIAIGNWKWLPFWQPISHVKYYKKFNWWATNTSVPTVQCKDEQYWSADQLQRSCQLIVFGLGSSINDVMLLWGIFYPLPPPQVMLFMHPSTLLVMRTWTPLPPPLRHDVTYGRPLVTHLSADFCLLLAWFVGSWKK